MGEETKKKAPDAKTDQGLETEEETAVTEEQQESGEESSSALDKVLEDPDLKAEFAARVQEAVDAALADVSTGEDTADDTVAEDATDGNAAEEEAEGSAAEDPETGVPEEDVRAKDLNAREKSLLQRELRATAIEELSKEQLPTALADCFNYESDESFRASKEKCIKAFQEAIKEAVNERLRGSRTPKTSGEGAKGSARRTSFADTINKANKR